MLLLLELKEASFQGDHEYQQNTLFLFLKELYEKYDRRLIWAHDSRKLKKACYVEYIKI